LALLKDILIVDDQYDIVDILQIVLRKEGFRVHGFTDPALALDFFKADPKKFALVITDMRMPGMNGIELVSKIKEIKQDMQAILISAFERDTIDDEINRHNVKIAEVVQKPFSLNSLAKIVKNILM
jgi:DNA-binding NtrC family response regulator